MKELSYSERAAIVDRFKNNKRVVKIEEIMKHEYGQISFHGSIVLKNAVEMTNRKNLYLAPGDKRWDNENKFVVSAGTKVNFHFQETYSGNFVTYHFFRNDRKSFTNAVQVDSNLKIIENVVNENIY